MMMMGVIKAHQYNIVEYKYIRPRYDWLVYNCIPVGMGKTLYS